MASRFFSNSLKMVGSLSRTSFASNIAKCQSKFTPIALNTRTFNSSAVRMSDGGVYSELNSFLVQEIKIEQEARKQTSQVTKMKDFDLKADGANVELVKSFAQEKITVKFNVNHSLDSEAGAEESVESAEKNEPNQMKSRPAFTIDIKKNDKVLSFGCSFLPAEDSSTAEPMEDFQIDEFSIYEGEFNEAVYSVDCTVLDGQLYDILLNLLEERGIGEDFANNLAEFATSYEHLQYINLLENLKDFSK